MANIKFDFSKKYIFKQDNTNNFKYRDIGTSNIKIKVDKITGKETLADINTSNDDIQAINASLTNILNFKNGESILDPKFGMSELYQLIYSPFDKYSSGKIIDAIKTIINTYEPRIEIIDLPATYSEEKQEYYITINYFIPELGIPGKFNYTIVK
jgi:phage baseplate assembly protein W